MVSNIESLVSINKIFTKVSLFLLCLNFLYILALRMSTWFKFKKYSREDRQIAVYYEVLKLGLFISLGLRLANKATLTIVAYYVIRLSLILAIAGATSHLFLCLCNFEYSNEGRVINKYSLEITQKIKSNRNISLVLSIIAIIMVKLILLNLKSLLLFVVVCIISVFLITFSCNFLRRSDSEIIYYLGTKEK